MPRGRRARDGDLGRARVLGGAKNQTERHHQRKPKEAFGDDERRSKLPSSVCVSLKLLNEDVYFESQYMSVNAVHIATTVASTMVSLLRFLRMACRRLFTIGNLDPMASRLRLTFWKISR